MDLCCIHREPCCWWGRRYFYMNIMEVQPFSCHFPSSEEDVFRWWFFMWVHWNCSVHCLSHMLDRETWILSRSWKNYSQGSKIIPVSEVLSLLVLVVLVLRVTQQCFTRTWLVPACAQSCRALHYWVSLLLPAQTSKNTPPAFLGKANSQKVKLIIILPAWGVTVGEATSPQCVWSWTRSDQRKAQTTDHGLTLGQSGQPTPSRRKASALPLMPFQLHQRRKLLPTLWKRTTFQPFFCSKGIKTCTLWNQAPRRCSSPP